jgi:hypothetical protein
MLFQSEVDDEPHSELFVIKLTPECCMSPKNEYAGSIEELLDGAEGGGRSSSSLSSSPLTAPARMSISLAMRFAAFMSG